MVYSWIDGIGYGRRMHTCAARRVIEDGDIARGFSNGAKTAGTELVAAAADEVLDIIAVGISGVDGSADHRGPLRRPGGVPDSKADVH